MSIEEMVRQLPSKEQHEVMDFVQFLILKKRSTSKRQGTKRNGERSAAMSTKEKEERRKKTMALAGSFNDMSDEDYRAYVKETKRLHKTLFRRKVEL